MSYEEFKVQLEKMLLEQLGSGVEAVTSQRYKVNLGKVEMLSLFEKGKDGVICAPAVCLPLYYKRYQKSGSMEEIVSEIVKGYPYQGAEGEAFARSVGITDYSRVKDRLYFRLVNAEKNREMLAGNPCLPFLNLSIVFNILAIEDNEGIGNIMVTQDLIDCWGISMDELRERAGENTPKLFPAKLTTMAEMLGQILFGGMENGAGAWKEEMGSSQEMMYVLTNDRGINGFSTVLYPETLQEFADKLGKDLYVVPSSIHEAILLPDGVWGGVREIRKMVREVNRDVVSEQEMLSDEVYFFQRETGILRIAKEGADYSVQDIG